MRPRNRSGSISAVIARLRRGSLLLLALLLVGCDRPPADGVTLRFWAMGREAEVVSGLIREFEAENPGIRVEVQNIPWTAAHEKLLTAFAADGLPDICQLGNTWIPEFATLGSLTPLQPYVDASSGVQPADYFQGIWDTNLIQDELVGIPWYVDTRLLFYRKDLLRKAGFDHPPQTWAQWETMMAAIKKMQGPDRYAVLMPINEFEQQLSFALQQPDPLLRDDDTRGNFRSPGFQRALEILESGEIGQVKWVRADLGFPAPMDDSARIWAPADGGGALLDISVYPLLWAWGTLGRPDTVSATAELTALGVDAANTLTLSYANGAQAQLISYLASHGPRTATVSGTEGFLETIGSVNNPKGLKISVGRDNERVEMFEHPGSGYTYQLREVTRCIQAGLTESATMPLDDSLAIMELFDDARRQIGVSYANDTRTDL